LTRAERMIVVLYYYEEMTMKEIGLTLDLSESRVSQMHSSILARLKSQMHHRSKEF
jgi:RNA polymerase sigma factor for flagellar operon FliA